jgi:hypothetical protein
MQKNAFLACRCFAFVLMFLVVTALAASLSAQHQMGIIVQNAPLLLIPDKTRSPLLIMEKGVTVQVIRREGDWFNVTVQGSQWGDRTGYVEAQYLQLLRASVAPSESAPPPNPATERIQAARPVTTEHGSSRAPKSLADVSLKNVRRIFIEPMPGDLDQYIRAEITKEMNGRLVIVLDKANADAIMRGVGVNKSGVAASITLIDPNETVVLWASEAGDRSLMRGALARGGQRKVADRLVNNLKKALNDAK